MTVTARVSGFLEKRVCTEGSLVKEGDVFFLMDAKPFKVQVDAQAAALARQQAGARGGRPRLHHQARSAAGPAAGRA